MGMTIDDCIKELLINKEDDTYVLGNETIDFAINTMRKYQKLEQEPTTKNDLAVDCVARKDVERYIEGFINEYTPREELEFINLELDVLKHLPSVTPQEPKTGHWVHGEYCSECGCDVPAYIVDWKWQKDMDAKYCPNCGAKMVEPQESEDKE